MYKNIKLLAVLLLFVVSMVPYSALADDDQGTIDNININRIEIDDFENANGEYGPFYAGERIHVKVHWNALGDNWSAFDAQITVELEDIEDETKEFTVRPGWEDTESFVINLPIDIDADTYTLAIEIEDEEGNKEVLQDIKLEVVQRKHYVEIYDVNFPFGLEVNAGQTFFTSVGVKNLGHEDEEDIKVSLTIPALGLYQRTGKFDLFTEDYVKDESNDDDDEWKDYKELFVTIPANTVSGVYDVIIKVDYDDGDESEELRYSLVVGQGTAPADDLISIDKSTQTFAQGSGAVYTVMFPENADYTVEVDGIGSWGSVIIDENEGQAYVFVSADEDATSGSYPFTVKVKAGSSIVRTFDLTANVTQFAESPVTDIKEGLQIGFAILLIILIILGIILAAKKIGKSDNYEETLMDEGETYY
jgi:uncharacterized membrane protein